MAGSSSTTITTVERLADDTSLYKATTALTAKAFQNYVVWQHVYPDETSRPPVLLWTFECILYLDTTFDHARYYLMRDETGQLVGSASATLVPPTGCASDALWAQLRSGFARAPLMMSPTSLYRLLYLGNVATEWCIKDTKAFKDGYWYIRDVGVDPERQGKGLGSAMVTEVVRDSLARRKLPVYLMTNTEKNVRIYQKIGFKVVSEGVLFPGTDVIVYGMVHEDHVEQ